LTHYNLAVLPEAQIVKPTGYFVVRRVPLKILYLIKQHVGRKKAGENVEKHDNVAPVNKP